MVVGALAVVRCVEAGVWCGCLSVGWFSWVALQFAVGDCWLGDLEGVDKMHPC